MCEGHLQCTDVVCTWPALNRFCSHCSCYNGPSFSVQVCGVGGEGVAGRGHQFSMRHHHITHAPEKEGTCILALPGRSVAREGEREGTCILALLDAVWQVRKEGEEDR